MDNRDVFYQRTDDRKSTNYKLMKSPAQNITDAPTAHKTHTANHHFDRLMNEAYICLNCRKKHCSGACDEYKAESKRLKEERRKRKEK